MRAIPLNYPVIVQVPMAEAATPVLLSGVLGELVTINRSAVTEGRGQVSLTVTARNEAAARRRAEASTGGQVVEVGQPTPLQHFAKQRALPHGRSRVFSRFKAGRFNVQGGTGSHMPASMPTQPTVAECVESLLGPPPTLGEATDQQRAQRELRRKKWRSQNPQLARQRSMIAKRTASRRAGKRRSNQAAISKKAARFRGKFNPNFESVDNPPLDRQLAGFPEALKVHEHLRHAPEDWFRSQRGRSLVVSAIESVRDKEGNSPADVLENAYLRDSSLALSGSLEESRSAPPARKLQTIHVRFINEKQRNAAVENICRFTETCQCAAYQPGMDATFSMCTCGPDEALGVVEDTLRKMHIVNFHADTRSIL